MKIDAAAGRRRVHRRRADSCSSRSCAFARPTRLPSKCSYGWDETVDALTMVFRFLQKLGGQVPLKMLGGPGTIAVAAGDAASQGLSSLLIFLTMLSANLAVINFLPIPLLDGGHMVFLAYEGIRGRPANEKVVLGAAHGRLRVHHRPDGVCDRAGYPAAGF